MPDAVQKLASPRNRILAGLSRKEYARIAPDLKLTTLTSGQVLYEPASTMHWAYFLETAIASILSQAENGSTIEVSLVGREGIIGTPIFLRSLLLPYRIVVQAPGTAWKMKGETLRREFDLCGALHKLSEALLWCWCRVSPGPRSWSCTPLLGAKL